jgi:hypothetical protein
MRLRAAGSCSRPTNCFCPPSSDHRHIHTAPACRLDQFERLGRLAEIARAHRLVVRHLGRQAALFPDADGLHDGLDYLVALAPHVRNVDPAELPDHLREFDNLGGRSKIPRHIVEACGHAEGAVAHRLPRNPPHPIEFVRRRIPVNRPDHRLPYASLPHERSEVH